MSNVVRKNLGAVTAYKYAVSQGFEGTEQEFAALMASYATVAQEAESAKDDAIDAKTAAEAAQAAAEEAASQAEGAIEVDDTLSVAGRAADAGETGRRITDLKSKITVLGDSAPITIITNIGAYIDGNTHKVLNASYTKLVYAKINTEKVVTITKTAGKSFSVGFTTVLPANNVDVIGFCKDATASEITVAVPDTAEYIVAYVYNANTDSGTAADMVASVAMSDLTTAKDNVARGDISNLNAAISDISADVDVLSTPISDIIYHAVSDNLFNGVKNPGYVSSDGVEHESSSYFYTDKIDVHNLVGETLKVDKQHGTTANMRFVCVYDANGNVDSTLGSDMQISSYTVPQGAYYVRISLSAQNATYITITTSAIPVYTPYRDNYVVDKYDAVTGVVDIPKPGTLYADILASGSKLEASDVNSVKRLGTYCMYCKPGTLTDDNYIIFGKNGPQGYAFGVSKSKWAWFVNDAIQGNGMSHGLTIKDYIFIIIDKVPGTGAVVTLYTNGGTYTRTNSSWDDNRGAVYVYNNSGDAITDVKATWTSDSFRNRNWIFGDSYVSIATTRWPYYLYDWGFGNNVLINGYPGETSEYGYQDYITCLKNGKPTIAIWCLGMNDADSGAINASWIKYIQAFLSVCKTYQITPILATIPCCPNVDHSYKNAWVRSSGYRYIDFASAVNPTQDVGIWYDGMLSNDNIHPTAQGAIALASQVLTDFPELLVN